MGLENGKREGQKSMRLTAANEIENDDDETDRKRTHGAIPLPGNASTH
jgi:hypothetical protein